MPESFDSLDSVNGPNSLYDPSYIEEQILRTDDSRPMASAVMRIYLTGGTGYIGKALAARLLSEGHELHCLVRPTSDRGKLEGAGAACFVGELTERESLAAGMKGCDLVIHAAAELDLRVPREQMEAVNVAGSENVARLAVELGVKRLLSVSSMAFFGGSCDDGSPGNEESSPRRPFLTAYSATKNAAQLAIEAITDGRLVLDTVYPSLVYGPPGKKGGTNPLLRALARGRLRFLVGADRIVRWVFIDDVVDAMVRILDRAPAGRGYLLTGEAATVRQVANLIAEHTGVPAPRFDLPLPLARVGLRLSSILLHLVGRRSRVRVEQLGNLRRHWNFDDRHAREKLNWHPRPLAEGLPPTLDFLLERP